MITQKQVKEAMQKQELSQRQLAQKAKISESTLSNWFAGRQNPSDITLTRLALALGLDVGDTTDEQITDAPAEEAPEISPATDEDAVEAEIQTAADAPAYSDDAESAVWTHEDIAVAEIMEALGLAEEEDEPEPAAEPAPEPETEPEPEPTVEIRAQSPAELIYELTRLPGCYIYEDRDGDFGIAIPANSDLERFCRNLQTLDTMLDHGDIDADAHRTVCESLLARYKEEV